MRTKFFILAVALLCLLALPATALAGSANAKIDDSVTEAIDGTGGATAVPVIVFTDADATSAVQNAVPAGVELTAMPDMNAVAGCLLPSEIDAVAADSAVNVIVADNPVYGFDYASSMDVTNLTIGLDKIAAPATGGPAGQGVGVAVIDSGVATTSDLGASRIVAWKDFVNKQKTPYDDAGHGTFVAGLIAGDGTASLPLDSGGVAKVQFRGVAPAANIIGLKVLDATGEGRGSDVMDAIIWAVKHRDRYGIRVINLSLGGNPVGPVQYDPIALAASYAWLKGITVVCAAGNEGASGAGGILSPGNSPFVLTVGATDTLQTADTSDDSVTFYSSVGPTLFDEYAKPDVVAPGNRLISMRAPGSYLDQFFPDNIVPVSDYVDGAPADAVPSYLRLSGTSAAAPVVAGSVALLLSADPSLTPDDVKTRLMATADPVAGADRFQQGAGLIDLDQALADTSRADGYALSEDVGDGLTYLTKDSYATWEQSVWAKYGWMKFKWSKFKWSKFKWSDFTGTKFKWSKFKWSEVGWNKFKWSKFKWSVAWDKFKWSKFKWSDYEEWTKFKWSILVQGQ